MQTNGSGTSAAHAPSLPSFLLAAAVVFPFLILGDFPTYLGNSAIPEGARTPSHTPKDLLIKVPPKDDEDLLLRGTPSTCADEVALSSTWRREEGERRPPSGATQGSRQDSRTAWRGLCVVAGHEDRGWQRGPRRRTSGRTGGPRGRGEGAEGGALLTNDVSQRGNRKR